MRYDFLVPSCACPGCGVPLIGASNVWDGDKPQPGDASMCIKCGIISVFDAGMKLRPPTKKEFAKLSRDGRVQQMGMAHTAMRKDTKQ